MRNTVRKLSMKSDTKSGFGFAREFPSGQVKLSRRWMDRRTVETEAFGDSLRVVIECHVTKSCLHSSTHSDDRTGKVRLSNSLSF
jgi:hypothetical protein